MFTTSQRQKKHREKKNLQKSMLSIGEAASELGVCIDTLRQWDRTGKLVPHVTSGGHRRYLRSEIEQLSHSINPVCLRNNSAPLGFDLIASYGELAEYSRAFAKGDIEFLLLIGSPGSGKSQQIKKDIANVKHKWIDNHASNMGLYISVFEANNSHIVMDDVNHFFSSKMSLSIIKSITQTEKKRQVCWESTTTVLDNRGVPRSYFTSSPLCMIGNTWQDSNDDYLAIRDRAIPVAFYPSPETIHNKVVESGWCDKEVCDFIKDNLDIIINASMREYYNAMRYKKAGMDWKKKLLSVWGQTPVSNSSTIVVDVD